MSQMNMGSSLKLQEAKKYGSTFWEDMVSEMGMKEAVSYTAVFALTVVGYFAVSDGSFAALMVLASVFQAVAFLILMLKVHRCKQSREVPVVSQRMLQLFLVIYVMRLSSTLQYKGYTPDDGAGKFLYQMVDLTSLGFIVTILCMLRSQGQQAQRTETFPLAFVIAASLLVAFLIKPHMNGKRWTDVTWTCAVYLECFAMIPQLMVVQENGRIEQLMSHFLAGTFMCRLLNCIVWFEAGKELTGAKSSSILPQYFVVGAHVVQVVLLLDFMMVYVRMMLSKEPVTWEV